MSTPTPALFASSLMPLNSDTVGAPGFSRNIVEHLAFMHSVNNLGLSAVRPLINAHRGRFGSGKSDTDVPNTVPYLDLASSAHALNSVPPGLDAPCAERNHGSMT
jgi:hypothetical protein